MGMELTTAEVDTIRDSLLSLGIVVAGLVGAVADAIGEVRVAAKAGSITRGASKVGGKALHVLDARRLRIFQ